MGIAVAVATSAACRSGDSSGAADETGGWGWDIDSIIEDAAAAGAGPEQIAILEEAREAGEVPFEVYSEAVDRALRCIREAGGRATDLGSYEEQGILWRGYSVGVETEEADPVEFLPGATVHRCVAEHSIWVEFAYQNQPSSVEARDAFWEQYRDAIVACLHAEGIDEIVGDEPMSDLRRISAEEAYNVDGRAEQNCADLAFAGEEAEG